MIKDSGTILLTVSVFLMSASPQQGDLRLSGPPSGQGAGSGARTRDRRVPVDLRADSQATVLPTPQQCQRKLSRGPETVIFAASRSRHADVAKSYNLRNAQCARS
ncbi:hypothetical protein PoB_005638800 [Plakobranchus ocellatus]|uniref:Secreted protein n=1 Tax=Plakobranchus ocellatus TaxID=259542 RepID=A0AAV4CEI3_9GAST|nr:hypothetical protein PoB_005638800 [Plakobranchus ocellatus]